MYFKGGFNSTQLKVIALILMIFDHIHYFFGFTGIIPEWFSMIGRLSAPIFLFCMIEGFSHTHNRKMYYLRIALIASIMGLIQYTLILFNLFRPDGFFPLNAIFSNFVVLIIIFQGIEYCKNKKWIFGLSLICIPLFWPVLAIFLLGFQNVYLNVSLLFLHYTILPIYNLLVDGGSAFIILGMLMYIFKDNKKLELTVFGIYTFILYFIVPYCLIPFCTLNDMFFKYYEWYGIFSILILINYNGLKGNGNKHFFYYFYPAHVYIFFYLSWILMNNIK